MCHQVGFEVVEKLACSCLGIGMALVAMAFAADAHVDERVRVLAAGDRLRFWASPFEM
jgi:hypothetical protein